MKTNLQNENKPVSSDGTEQLTRTFFRCIPLYLAVPVAIWLIFAFAGMTLDWKAFGIGALGWFIALMLRGPVSLLVKRLPQHRAKTWIIAASGPLEEGIRLAVIALTGASFSNALSVGQGWAAIEVLFTVINGIVLASVLHRDDEKAQQAKELLQASGYDTSHPLWGVWERLFASAFHIGATLLIATSPLLLILLVPLHSGFNLISVSLSSRSMVLTQMFVAVVGTAVLTAGLLFWNIY